MNKKTGGSNARTQPQDGHFLGNTSSQIRSTERFGQQCERKKKSRRTSRRLF